MFPGLLLDISLGFHMEFRKVLPKLIRYTFDTLKVLLSTLAFTAFELPPNGAIGTKILQFLFDSRPDLVRFVVN